MRLFVSRRALADLKLDVDSYAGQPAEELTETHEVVRAFVRQRRQSAKGQEAIQLPKSHASVYSLHVGRWRALTWEDLTTNVVWLIGVGYHRSGDHTDAYKVLKARDRAGVLFPDEIDYLDVIPDPEPFVSALNQDASMFVARSRERLGEIVSGILGGAFDIEMLTREADGGLEMWISFFLPPKRSVPPDWLIVALASLFPTADEVDFRYDKPFPRPGPPKKGEIVVGWRDF